MAADYMTDDDIRRILLDRADRYCALTGTTRTSLGLAVLNDGSALADIKDGRDIRLGTYRKFMAWLDRHWPADAPPTPPAA
jgi:hypothetical protein